MTHGSGRRGELDINELIMCEAIFLSEVLRFFSFNSFVWYGVCLLNFCNA